MKIFLIICASLFLATGAPLADESGRREFSQFSVILPAGWDGDEQSGFISDNPEEYLLTLGRTRDDNFVAQVSIFLLPNKPGASAEKAARQLAEAQGDASEPAKKDNFWIFTGEPRTKAMKGIATTMVNATPEHLLIIIAQDPENLGSQELLQSLRGQTPLATSLLGR